MNVVSLLPCEFVHNSVDLFPSLKINKIILREITINTLFTLEDGILVEGPSEVIRLDTNIPHEYARRSFLIDMDSMDADCISQAIQYPSGTPIKSFIDYLFIQYRSDDHILNIAASLSEDKPIYSNDPQHLKDLKVKIERSIDFEFSFFYYNEYGENKLSRLRFTAEQAKPTTGLRLISLPDGSHLISDKEDNNDETSLRKLAINISSKNIVLPDLNHILVSETGKEAYNAIRHWLKEITADKDKDLS